MNNMRHFVTKVLDVLNYDRVQPLKIIYMHLYPQ